MESPHDDSRSVDELISAALSEPDEDLAWNAIWVLRWRGIREVFDRASGLCRSYCPVERKLGAAILGQLGIPNRSFPKSCLEILLSMLEAEQDRSVISSILYAYVPHISPAISRNFHLLLFLAYADVLAPATRSFHDLRH
ncbi:hypothetical protein SAMN05444166_1700 [Singulisphaera sp. GP187]|uniref:hypothetical protein n=1 Tax=Singulisphaera sp. GP187 TaxID=1882752 RepID=UPI0009283D81|nr:hypothetical protein [Singulisphaera sp. GP187]SIN93887.1 hypothetical protein SAMN05444166_1700 [Singulisphaera sp. GP187]